MSNEIVKTAGRTLDVFEAFQTIRRPTSLSELAELIGIPMSSCHGLVSTLRSRGYVYSVAGRTLYPTRRLLDIATAIAAHDPILEQLKPQLELLRDKTEETVLLGKRQQNSIVYLDVVEGLHTIRYVARVGEFKPLHSSAIGKAMLGRLPPADLKKFVKDLELPKITDRTLDDPDELVANIEAGRKRGYFVTRGENVAEVMAIAVAIPAGLDWVGIAVAGPIQRVEANFERYLACLTEIGQPVP